MLPMLCTEVEYVEWWFFHWPIVAKSRDGRLLRIGLRALMEGLLSAAPLASTLLLCPVDDALLAVMGPDDNKRNLSNSSRETEARSVRDLVLANGASKLKDDEQFKRAD